MPNKKRQGGSKVNVSIRLERQAIRYFKQNYDSYTTVMAKILQRYVSHQKRKEARTAAGEK